MVESVMAYSVGDTYTQSQMTSLLDAKSNVSSTGLVLLNTTSFTAAANVAIDNVFTSSYTNYRMVLNLTAVSDTDININWYGRTSGSDVTTNYNYQRYFFGTSSGTQSGSSSILIYTSTASTTLQIDAFIGSPQLAQNTIINTNGMYSKASSGDFINFVLGKHTSTNQFDGIKLFPSSGTITGTIKVYGYK
jgi:hypothetical protein